MSGPARWALGFGALFALYHLPDLAGRQLLASALAMGAFPLASWAVLRWLGAGWAAVGLSPRPGWRRSLGAGLAVGLATGALSVGASAVLGLEVPARAPRLSDLGQVPVALAFTFFPSLAEDVLTRGYLWAWLRPRLREGAWVALSTGVYVANHLHRLGDGAPVLLYLAALGVGLGVAVSRTGALWLALGVHWGGNLLLQLAQGALEPRAVQPGAAQWVHAGALALQALALVAALGGRRAPAPPAGLAPSQTNRTEDPA